MCVNKLNKYTNELHMEKMPERFQEQWKSFLTQSDVVLSCPLFDSVKMELLMDELRFCKELKLVIHSQSKVMEENNALNIISKFLKWALFVDCVPWENDAYDLNLNVPIMGKFSAVMGLTVLCSGMIDTIQQARNRKIPEKYLNEVKKWFLSSVKEHYKVNKRWGIAEFGWNILTASFVLFKIGKYRFNLEHYANDCVLFHNKKTNEAIALSLPNYEFNYLGERVSSDEAYHVKHGGFISRFEETDEYVKGTYLTPVGFAVNETIRLDKSQWKKKVYSGCVTIGFHINTGVDYTPNSIKIDFKKATRFYRRYFPEFKFTAFICDSWLFSPQLQILFDESESKIVRVQRETYLIAGMSDDSSFQDFVFSGEKLDPKTSPRDTTLKRRILDFIEKGGTIRGGTMILLIEDVNRIGVQPYYNKNHFIAIKELYEKNRLI